MSGGHYSLMNNVRGTFCGGTLYTMTMLIDWIQSLMYLRWSSTMTQNAAGPT